MGIGTTGCGEDDGRDTSRGVPHDGDQQERGGFQLTIFDAPQIPGGGEHMPAPLTMATKKAFEKNYAFPYENYACTKGSEWPPDVDAMNNERVI